MQKNSTANGNFEEYFVSGLLSLYHHYNNTFDYKIIIQEKETTNSLSLTLKSIQEKTLLIKTEIAKQEEEASNLNSSNLSLMAKVLNIEEILKSGLNFFLNNYE